jgi:phosphatidylinositol glycan class F
MTGSKEEAPLAAPIEVLDTDSARLYTHIHPILVLSLYAISFPAIVANPISGLTYSLPWLLVLQVVYTAICLPPMEGGTASAEKKRPREKKRKPATSALSVGPKALVSLRKYIYFLKARNNG